MRSLSLVSLLLLGLAATVQPADAADVQMFVRHEVADYVAWRKAYDALDARWRELGVTSRAVYRSIDNTNDVTLVLDFRSADKAMAFAPDLKAAMEKAGVKDTQIWLTTTSPAISRSRPHLPK
jgi:hypothetical protein